MTARATDDYTANSDMFACDPHNRRMTDIKQVKGREILDSRGNPTVEAEAILDNGTRVSAAVPSGASSGEREAVELREQTNRQCRHRTGRTRSARRRPHHDRGKWHFEQEEAGRKRDSCGIDGDGA